MSSAPAPHPLTSNALAAFLSMASYPHADRTWPTTSEEHRMSELNFQGKEFVYNHRLSVPFRPFVMDPDKGVGEPSLGGNLIIHGDNLHALRGPSPALRGLGGLRVYRPALQHGERGWSYNDNVNAPMIREWLNANPIGIEDGLAPRQVVRDGVAETRPLARIVGPQREPLDHTR